MKMKFGLMLAVTLSTAVMAQVPNPPASPSGPPVLTPPPSVAIPTTPTNAIKAESAPTAEAALTNSTSSGSTTNAVPKAKKSSKKKAAKKDTTKKPAKKDSVKSTNAAPSSVFGEPLVVNEPATAMGKNVNIRGQANINSEVVGHLKQGESVTVLEMVTSPHIKKDEPSHWAKITLPESIHVWVNHAYLSNDAVAVKKLNMRTGPGENYSVAGMLHRGDAVKPGTKKGEWIEIDAPTNAFGFVAAHLLTHKAAAPAVVTPPVVQPTETVVTAAPPLNIGNNETSATNATPTAPVPTALPAADEPPPRRIIEREGIVGGTVSIQAPTHYQLYSLDDGHVMDYLFSNTTNLMVGKYKGMTVFVTGEEELDERWPNTPVITIQKIQVVK